MKTIITASGNTVDSVFDKRFGRAAYFCVFNDENGETEFVENVNLNAKGGAGTKTAEAVVTMGVAKVISGDFGPKAKELLDKFNVQMVIMQDDGSTVSDIIAKLKA